jgi:hypothetical protein
MARTPRRTVTSTADGEIVRLVGVAETDEPQMRSPLGRHECVAYSMFVWLWGKWIEIDRFTDGRACNLRLRDASGTALIRVKDARIALALDETWEYQPGVLCPPSVDEYLAQHRRCREDGQWLRLREGTLRNGCEIAVVGLARWEPDPDAGAGTGYRDAPQRLVLCSTEAVPLVVSNDHRARR